MQGTYLIDSINLHVARVTQGGTIASRALDVAVVTRQIYRQRDIARCDSQRDKIRSYH